MYRLVVRPGIILLTFAIGVSANFLWISMYRNNVESVNLSPKTRIFMPTNRESTEGWWKQTYKANDGATVIVERLNRGNSFIRYRLDYGVEVIERQPILDNKGQEVGERVVASLASNKGYDFARAVIMWSDGEPSYAVYASSLEEALLLEKNILTKK